MTESDFTLENSDSPTNLSREEYEETVENIAQQVIHGTEIEQYDSEDGGISQILESHLYCLDVYRALQVIQLSDNTPVGWNNDMDLGDDWKQAVSKMARIAMTKDIRDRVEKIQ